MLHLGVSMYLLFTSARRGIWSKWCTYQSTIYYIVLFNLYYEYISNFTKKHLWEFSKPFLNLFITESIYTFVTLPCLTLLFLSNYPDHNKSKIFYHYVKWIIISFMISCLGYKLGYIYYANGYTLLCEFVFYSIMYPMLRLHFQKPRLALIISFFIALMYLSIFNYKIL